MRSAVNRGLVLGVYLAWGVGSCAVSEDIAVLPQDAGAPVDESVDVPAVPDEDIAPVVEPDAPAPRDVPADASAPPRDASAPRDAGPVADSLPVDAVMFFRGAACPSGWAPYLDGVGRAVAVAANATLNGYSLGSPLGDREVRGHTHNFSGIFALDAVSYVGVVGGGNTGTSAAGTVRFDAQTSSDPAGLPYVQLLVCRKTGPVMARPLPSGLRMFYAGMQCPSGWTQPVETRGRVMVGLPRDGQDGAAFGGAPIGQDTAPQHTHPTTTQLTAAGHGIALATGCCGGGYARAGTYRMMGRTEGNSAGMPTIQLLQCQRE
jgi:hypothetical protein